jgi:hypothetical protein
MGLRIVPASQAGPTYPFSTTTLVVQVPVSIDQVSSGY